MEPIYLSKWITSPVDTKNKVFAYKKSVYVKKKIKSATLFSSAIGVYTSYINEKKADIYPLAPGFTLFSKRVQYQKTDITPLVIVGENTVSLSVGLGFLRQEHFHDRDPKINLEGLAPGDTAVIAAIVIEYASGESETVFTDKTWTISETKYRFSDMYDGDVFDATFEPSEFFPARELPATTDTLVYQEGEIISEHENLPVKEIIKTPRGETVLDFGQNITGYIRMRVRGERGAVCRLIYGEVLDKDGNFYNENYRSAKAATEFICDGNEHIFSPEYTFYGFRYVKVESWPGDVSADGFSAVVLHSDIRRTGYFECSDERINKLYRNIIWGQKGNFLDIPTDCPQRDERMGWTGDAQVFSMCAALNYDVLKFFKKWLCDMRLCQKEDGRIPSVVPSYWSSSSSAWSDACVIIPYNLFLIYGDRKILSENYDMMRRWVEYLMGCFEEYTSPERFHFGDWLALEKEDNYSGLTPKGFIAAAYAARSTDLFIKSSETLGIECEKYKDFLAVCRKKIRDDFSDEEEYEKSNPESSLKTQTYYAVRLAFGLYDTEKEKAELAKKLASLIDSCGNHLTTGFVGTPCLLFALSDNGYAKKAYDLLLRDEYPSWLYSVKMGATTIWEHWNGIKENGEMWDKAMNSFNHYAYGAVGEWMYTVMAGINPSSPGFSGVLFRPVTDGRITYVKASLDTPHGKVSSEWRKCGDKTEYKFTVPAGVPSCAVIDGKRYELSSGENILKI